MFERVMRRLKEDGIDLSKVSRDTGFSYSWLRQLRAGRFIDPGVQKIELLDNYFRTEKAA